MPTGDIEAEAAEAARPFRIGVDLGGTKIEVIALDAAGRECLRRRTATPQGDYPATVRAVAALVAAAEAELGARGSVGIGTPGTLSAASGRMKNANSTCLNGQPLDRDLVAALARPVRMANDADCLAQSEAVDGAGAGHRTVFAVILGTGVGGGICIDRRLLSGPNGIAGEWGHNPLPAPDDAERPGPACYCGRSGCVETFLSGPGLAADHARAAGLAAAGPDAAAIADLAAAGDAAAAASMARYERRLAKALAGVVNILDPEAIVLGGGLSRIGRLYDHVPRLWAPHIFSDTIVTRLKPALHGDSSGVRGAAWLWAPDGLVPSAGA